MRAFIITVNEAEIEIRVPAPTEEQLLEVGNASLRKSLREALAQTSQLGAMPVMVKATDTNLIPTKSIVFADYCEFGGSAASEIIFEQMKEEHGYV